MPKTRLLALVAAFAVGFAPMIATAAVVRTPPVYGANGLPKDSTAVLCIDTTGTYVGCGSGGTSSLAPWTPDNTSLQTLAPGSSATASSAFAGSGTTVYVKNTGTAPFHVRVGTAGVTATLTDERLQPGMCGPFARGTGDRVSLITDAGTGSAEVTTGTGNPGFGLCTDLSSAAVTNPWAPQAKWGDQNTNLTSTTTATTCAAAPGGGITRNIMAVTLNDHAATDTIVQLLDSDGVTVRWEGTAKANDMRGIVLPGPLKGAAANADWKCKTITSTGTGGVTFTLNFFDTP